MRIADRYLFYAPSQRNPWMFNEIKQMERRGLLNQNSKRFYHLQFFPIDYPA